MDAMDDEAQALADRYDPYCERVARDPYRVWELMREKQPVAWSDLYGGFYALTRYGDVVRAATDWETFTSAERVAIPPNDFPPALPIEVDPPLQREYRRILNPALSPQKLAEHEAEIRAFAHELVAAFPATDDLDLTEMYSKPFPKSVVLRTIGLPIEDRAFLSDVIDRTSMSSERGTEEAMEATGALLAYLAQKVGERRGRDPGDDVFGALCFGQIDGRPLSDEEVIGNMITTIFGGLHTTTLMINGMCHWLVHHPDACRRLVAEPGLVPSAVDEFLRFYGQGGGIGRTATRDTEVAGCPIRSGERVYLAFGAADHDPDEFPDPEEIVLDRYPNRHLAFGVGPHRCVGSHLAKLMVRVSLEELAPLLPSYEVADEDAVVWVGGMARGIYELPLRRRREKSHLR